MPQIRTALIGCGKIGRTHAQALSQLPESDFVAVCDSQVDRAESFAAEFHTAPYTDVATMVRQAAVQAVFVATPHPLHTDAVLAAVKCGAHALVEKPLAASLADCDRMIAAAKEQGVYLGTISQRRLYEPCLRLKAAIDAGKIGRPVLGVLQMFNWRDQAYYQSDPWRGRWDPLLE